MQSSNSIRRKDLIHPELSFQIIGCAFEVYNEIGFGHKEEIYQRAFKQLFEKKQIVFKEQVYYPVTFQGKTIGKNFFDFLVDDKVILELKKHTHFSRAHIEQVNNYLRVSGLQLAILVNFGTEAVQFRRVVNVNNNNSKIDL